MLRKLSTLQDYQFGRTIGEGTFGKVKIGFHKVTKEHVAIKILQKDKIIDSEQIQRLTRQISIMKSLNHKNIIKLYEIIQTKQQIYLIMQYAEQGDLMSYIISKRKLEQSEASAFLFQIVKATEYIHTLGIAHRDLKPTNILLGKKNQIKIADFGLSNIYKPGGRLKTSCGSPCYAAPQVIEGKAYQPVYVDIWSIGIVLFVMVCGYLPFHHKNTQTLYKLIFTGKYQITTNISPQVTNLIEGLIKTQPSKRLKFKQIMEHKWIKNYNSQINFGKVQHSRMNGEINREILNLMQKIELNPEQVKQQVKKNRHNRLTTIYHLFSRKSPREIDLFSFANEKHQSFELMRQSVQFKDRKYLQRTPRGECIKKNKNISSIEQKKFFQGTYLKITNSNNRFTNQQQNSRITQKNSLVQNKMKISLILPQNRVQTSRNNSPATSKRSSLDNKNSILKRYSFIKKDKSSDIECYDGPYNLDSVFNIKFQLLKLKIQTFFKNEKIKMKQIDKGIFSFDWESEENVNININKLNKTNLFLIRISSIKQNSIITLFQKLIQFLNQ